MLSQIASVWDQVDTKGMEDSFCVAALERALRLYPGPAIFNTDQGAQFTGKAFTGVLQDNDIQISMDGKGRCMDKDYTSHCTSFVRSDATTGKRRLFESFCPWLFTGAPVPRGSYRYSCLSLYA